MKKPAPKQKPMSKAQKSKLMKADKRIDKKLGEKK